MRILAWESDLSSHPRRWHIWNGRDITWRWRITRWCSCIPQQFSITNRNGCFTMNLFLPQRTTFALVQTSNQNGKPVCLQSWVVVVVVVLNTIPSWQGSAYIWAKVGLFCFLSTKSYVLFKTLGDLEKELNLPNRRCFSFYSNTWRCG